MAETQPKHVVSNAFYALLTLKHTAVNGAVLCCCFILHIRGRKAEEEEDEEEEEAGSGTVSAVSCIHVF
jgi:hypothetical protein